jgi:hypothetical protein
MPDFFDRLIARGAGQPGQAAVAFAVPRLPGPFERPTAPPLDPFIETIEETPEPSSAPTTARARPVLGDLPGTRSSPPPLTPDSITSRAPTGPSEPTSVRPALPRRSPPLPMATSVAVVPDAGIPAATKDQPTDRVSWPEPAFPPPAVPRALAIPASAVQVARPADARSAQVQPPGPPVVTVRIGRIEVRDTGHDRRERPANPANQKKRRAAPKTTLAAYLAAATEGTR